MKLSRLVFCVLALPTRLLAGAVEPEEIFVRPGGPATVSPASPGATVEVALAGEVLRPGPLTAPDAGEHWLAAATRDAAGGATSLRWLRLRVAPFTLAGAAEVDVSGERFYRPPVAVRRGSASAPGALEWSRDGETWAALDGAVEVSSEGLALRFSDAVGRMRIEHPRLDGTAPALTLAAAGGALGGRVLESVAGESLELRADDGSGCGVARFIATLDGRHWFRVTGTTLRFALEPGVHDVGAEAEDLLGNLRRLLWKVEVHKSGSAR
jgi:hypothetical protein